jgi:hypothetical protein
MYCKVITRHRIGFTVLACLLTAGLLTGCPPTPRCDEKIKDPKTYEDAIQAKPVIQELNLLLTQRNLTLGNCFVDGKVSIITNYNNK